MNPDLAQAILAALYGALLCYAWTNPKKLSFWTAIAIAMTVISGVATFCLLVAAACAA